MLKYLRSPVAAALAMNVIHAAYAQAGPMLQRILGDDFPGTNTEGKLSSTPDDIGKVHKSTKKYVSRRLDGAIGGGMLFVNSGHTIWGRMPGNVLLAFSVDGV